jgi:hypothetical protein
MAHAGPAYQLIAVKVINMTNDIEAIKITSRLNLRIRLWYSTTQPVSAPFRTIKDPGSKNPSA